MVWDTTQESWLWPGVGSYSPSGILEPKQHESEDSLLKGIPEGLPDFLPPGNSG